MTVAESTCGRTTNAGFQNQLSGFGWIVSGSRLPEVVPS